MLTTPAGNPASLMSETMYKAVSGVCLDGLKTIVLPQANAGQNFHAIIKIGWFHGIIWPKTPIGSCLV